ncbi:MAG: glycoside hydrolase family 3 N-terminal domain-containing protein [Spirochaetaceae bacterium]|nr:glycoside hydrolase family 3 N-terminal domain-containing protein [Spirochaetaceae bacterium]MDT8297201.1 glycoside hydrolase family 3 N-terminal domain-containing protein [Spirochaetaceae bacterium]
MLSTFLKHLVQKVMLSSSPDARQAEMNRAEAEDLDFRGLSPDNRSAQERAGDILRAMSLEEKVMFITGYKSLGIRALPRHGLPSVWMSDATSGPRSYGPTTAFPSAVAMAATWDPQLVARSADHIAEAARAKGVSILLGPGVNIARIPTCGRNFEYMGEDPYLAGALSSSYIRACKERGVICTVKHMAANNSEYDRHKVSSDLSDRALRELYLPAFEASVRDGQTMALMSAYNPVNGIWASENRFLLTEILREEWGFDGFVVSDWNSLYSTAGPLNSGLDLEMPEAKWLTPERVKDSESDLDRMAGNILRTLFAAGVYDRPVKDPQAREFHEDHDRAALDVALAGIVLLKNEPAGTDATHKALPLPEGGGATIAVCGPHAVNSPTLGGGSCHVARTTGTVDLLDGLTQVSADGTEVIHIPFRKTGLNTADRRIIADADAVVLACGFDYRSESELYDRPWRLPQAQRKLIERASALNPRCAVLLTAGGGVETESWSADVPAIVHGLYLGQSVGTAAARILFGRSNPSGKLPFTMAKRWNDIASVRGYPRRYWTTTPGRLAAGQGNPRFRKMRHWSYDEELMLGYRHFDTAGIEPAFCFGHGLSYTDFAVLDMSLSSNRIGSDEAVTVSVTVKNIGDRPGAEVIQIYVADLESRLPRPFKELKGFGRIYLEAGEAGVVRMELPPRSFQYWDPEFGGKRGSWVTEPGEFRIMAGRSSRLIEAEEKLVISVTQE